MQTALIFLESLPNGKAGRQLSFDERIIEKQKLHVAEEQAFALCRHMREEGWPNPILICLTGSALALRAKNVGMPVLEVLTGSNPLDLFRLWTWRRKNQAPLLIALGKKSLKCALALKKLPGHGSGLVNVCFFCPSREKIRLGKGVEHVLCGSEGIRQQLEADVEKDGPRDFSICPPGINLAAFRGHAPLRESGRFVFGMARSLLPGSGALLTVRAMSAMWQNLNLPQWEVRMFGAGSRFNEVLGEATNLGVNSRLGILWEQPLQEASAHCDAWIAPGSASWEPPETLLAGFAAGIPVICSRSSWHLEELGLVEGAAVAMTDCGNPQELARAMMSVMIPGVSNPAPKIGVWSLDSMADSAIRIIAGRLADRRET